MEIRLTPMGQLRWEAPEGETESAVFVSLRKAFQADWREGLFTLAAEKISMDEALTVRYWQVLAERYLTDLCHIPGATETFEVVAPSPAECASLVLTAPPMQGGEYLSAEMLQTIWEALDRWVHEAVAATGGLDMFLQTRATKWHQVGRVCFHLAENKNDDTRPFAFMVTYTAGFGAAGRLQHLPLRKALEQYAGALNRPALIKSFPLCSRRPSTAHGCRSWWTLAPSISPWRGRRDGSISSCRACRRSRRVASLYGCRTGGKNGPDRKCR